MRSFHAARWVFLIVVLQVSASKGQEKGFFVVDKATGVPPEFASVRVKEVNGPGTLQGILASNGWFEIGDLQFPLEVEIAHVNLLAFDGIINGPDSLFLDLKNPTLDEVVVTGQYESEPLKNSLIRVQLMEPRKLEKRGAVTLGQAVQYQLNYSLQPDPATGAVGLSIQGLDSRQVKILLDGVPVTGRTGNSVDMSQFNISNVERIEVVEGPLAVQYGTDAMAGVINIISKKPAGQKPFARVDIQEESVGQEYGSGQGIHQQSFFLGSGIGKNFYANLEFTHRFFGGYQGTFEGRTKQWDPKQNLYGYFKFGFRPKSWKLEYRLDVFDEKIESNANPSGLIVPIALDEEYKTRRFINQLNGYKSFRNSKKIDWVATLTHYERIKTQYAHNLSTGEKILVPTEGAQDTALIHAAMFRGIYSSNPFKGRLSYQLGVDLNYERAQGGRIEGTQWQSLGDYAGFGSVQYKFTPRLDTRLGLRFAYHTNYQGPVLPSFNVKYQLNQDLVFRASYARGFRAPTLKELYFDFFDSNHSISGNDQLKPEYSHHLDFGFNHQLRSGELRFLSSDLNFFFNDQTNQITFGQDADNPNITTYINADRYSTLGFALNEKAGIKHFEFGAGFGMTGRYNEFSDSLKLDRYLFSPEVNANLTYIPDLWGLSFSAFYKYTGKVPQYLISNESGSPEVVLGERDPFSWMDISISKEFPKHFSLVLGIKNVFDVTSVDQSISGGATHGSGGSYAVGYGRSFFIRLIFDTQRKS